MTPDYLLPFDPTDFLRPWDYFTAQVVHRRLHDSSIEHDRLQLEAARAFAEVHGTAALIRSLRQAQGMAEGLHGVLARLLDELREPAS
jgi:hypothetical protein